MLKFTILRSDLLQEKKWRFALLGSNQSHSKEGYAISLGDVKSFERPVREAQRQSDLGHTNIVLEVTDQLPD